MKQLPESIRREAKRLYKIAKESDGNLGIINLSQAQEIVVKIKGNADVFNALVPTPEPISKIDKLSLALAMGFACNDDIVKNWLDDPLDSTVVLCIATNDLKEFEVQPMSVWGGEWDSSNDTHMGLQYEIAICLAGCEWLPPLEQLNEFALQMFSALEARNLGYVFGYCSDSTSNEAYKIYVG